MQAARELLCPVTKRPFYPDEVSGYVVCSECGQVFIDPAPPLHAQSP